MSYKTWLNYLRSAEKTSVITGQLRKVHYKFPDGKQMAEEYSMETGMVLRRAWRKSKQLMGEPEWEIELGEIMRDQTVGDTMSGFEQNDGLLVRESNTAPTLSKRVTKRNIEWRIRNLPYDISVFDVKADREKHAIVVRTTNKKFYKIIPVPDLQRCELEPEQHLITIHHQYNTLVITYQKPKILIELDVQVLLMLKDVATQTDVIETLLRQSQLSKDN